MTERTKDDLDRLGKKWTERLKQAEDREESWLKMAKQADAIYLANAEEEGCQTSDFNILHSNVETIVSSIYNSTPSADIRQSHDGGEDKELDKIAKRGAIMLERAVAAQIDNNSLDLEVEASAQDILVAGRGIVRVRFDDEGGERVVYENVSWRDYREGPAKRWRDVPWVAYRHYISSEEKDRLEDEDIRAAYDDESSAQQEEKDVDVWEIWDRAAREVIFLIEESSRIISIKPDPLNLKGFFPQAAPVQPITGTGRRTPVCPYAIYQTQAEELDRITRRIDKIISGLKVRGAIVGDAEGISELAMGDDNTLTIMPDIQNIAVAGGLDKMVMWWPVETAIAVLRELYMQREQVKQTIYEITGISDIVRGQGAASETATAQNIKTQWGSLRIKKAQRLIERQVRDLLQITVEIMSTVFSDEAIQKASGMRLDPQVMAFIRTPDLFYRVDVESDSTVKADTGPQREEMTAFLASAAQYFQTMAPIVANAPATASSVVDIFAAFSRRFSLGKQAEDALDRLVELATQASEQPQEDPAKEAQAMEVKFKEMEVALKERELAIKEEELQIKAAEAQDRIAGNQAQRNEQAAKQFRDAVHDQDARELEARRLELDERRLKLDEYKLEIEAARAAHELEDKDEAA